ncbi:hypothetical protein [Bacillus smithii]|uniref:hypothetical protein n=1 Tax=Bacillus smithii TaxID=1479 RepID=UPI002E2452A4|nr:hypothetical protein [Bacillus smithii]MED4929156.1 hypothetical protein [Bacillus smithii]
MLYNDWVKRLLNDWAKEHEKVSKLQKENKQLKQKIEQFENAQKSYLQACDELEAHVNNPNIVLSIVSELREALKGSIENEL